MKKRNAAGPLTYVILILGAAICLLPLIWLVRSGFMETAQIFEMPSVWIPDPWCFENFSEALTVLPFGAYFLNSAFIAAGVIAGRVVTSSLCAYSFSRLNWTGRNAVFAVLLSSMMLPAAVTLIPTFIGWSYLGALDTYIPLILPAWFGGGAFNIFLLRQFFMTIPKELDEAALVDGAGYLRIYAQVLLPLIRPALIVVALFGFIDSWNDFLGPLVYLNHDSKYTVALGLQQFKGLYSAQWNYLMAASTIVLLPTVILFFIGQRYFIEGITLTGLKG